MKCVCVFAFVLIRFGRRYTSIVENTPQVNKWSWKSSTAIIFRVYRAHTIGINRIHLTWLLSLVTLSIVNFNYEARSLYAGPQLKTHISKQCVCVCHMIIIKLELKVRHIHIKRRKCVCVLAQRERTDQFSAERLTNETARFDELKLAMCINKGTRKKNCFQPSEICAKCIT